MEDSSSDALMTPPSVYLTLYVAVHRVDAPTCTSIGTLVRRYVGNKDHVGFRERPEDALGRASATEHTPVSKATHVLLRVSFSAEALARLTAESAGPAYGFASMLHKVTYRGREKCDTDWKVWHYCGDFPLTEDNGIEWEWVEIR